MSGEATHSAKSAPAVTSSDATHVPCVVGRRMIFTHLSMAAANKSAKQPKTVITAPSICGGAAANRGLCICRTAQFIDQCAPKAMAGDVGGTAFPKPTV